jgi:hypothetical protein
MYTQQFGINAEFVGFLLMVDVSIMGQLMGVVVSLRIILLRLLLAELVLELEKEEKVVG